MPGHRVHAWTPPEESVAALLAGTVFAEEVWVASTGHFITDELAPLPDELAEDVLRREALTKILGTLSERVGQQLVGDHRQLLGLLGVQADVVARHGGRVAGAEFPSCRDRRPRFRDEQRGCHDCQGGRNPEGGQGEQEDVALADAPQEVLPPGLPAAELLVVPHR